MSDPLSIAAGVIGVVTAAAQISSILIKFTKSTIKAPQQAQIVLTEVNDIEGILSQFQSYLLGIESPNRSRATLLKLDKVVTVVSGCVLTFSELEKLLDELKKDDLDMLDCLKWARKEAAIAVLVQRLQNHKASLALMLNILNGHTIAEARDSVDRLQALVEQCYKEMSSKVRALELLNLQKSDDADWMSGSEANSLATIRAHPPHLSSEEDMESDFIQFDFSYDLQMSRVYRRNQAFARSGVSLVTNSAYSLGWSFLSDLSMAEVSNISVINLAILEGEVFNPGRSSETWSAQRNQGGPTDIHVDQRHTFPFQVAHEPVRANIPVATGQECRPASDQTHQQSLSRDGSPTGPPEYPVEHDDECYPCKGCGEILEQGMAVKLGGNHWHMNCFRCTTCNTRILQSDTDLLLREDGSLICSNCTPSCSVCNVKLKDLAILTGDQAFCATCFKCRNCKKEIGNFKYARTSQGIFCMQCHESLRHRRRKKALTKGKEVSWLSLPSGAAVQASDTLANSSIISPDRWSEVHTQRKAQDTQASIQNG